MSNASFACGFCGVFITRLYGPTQCDTCGCWYNERPRKFFDALDNPAEEQHDVAVVSARHCAAFDIDDEQAHMLLSLESGWWLGERRLSTTQMNHNDDGYPGLSVEVLAAYKPTPPSRQEWTDADAYDRRNKLGRFYGKTPLQGE